MFPHTANRGFGPHIDCDVVRGRSAEALGEVVRFLRLCRTIGFLGICLHVLAAPNSAWAFTDPAHFSKPTDVGGTEGRWFTGAPTDGYGCDVCHSGKPSEKLIVEGLPKDGYVTEKEYQIRIAWPEFAERTRGLYATAPANKIPRASLVAEFVAESADDSGQIVQRALQYATKPELCQSTQRRLGSALYRQAPGRETKSVSVCDGVNTTRCLVAVKACGSEEVRFTWFAPVGWQGTIWFSASFVATEQMSITPLEDATTEITIPIPPAGNANFQSELEQACAVSRLGGAQGSLAPLGMLLSLLVWRGLRRRAGGRK
jgi:hypothetical protein